MVGKDEGISRERGRSSENQGDDYVGDEGKSGVVLGEG